MAKKIIVPKNHKDLPVSIVKQMLALATSGFGLVAALAWNNVIPALVHHYIKPYVSKGSGIISLIIYAIVITALAVFITLQLTRLEQTLSTKKPTQ